MPVSPNNVNYTKLRELLETLMKVNGDYKNHTILLLDESLPLDAEQPWEPQINEKYYFIDSCGVVDREFYQPHREHHLERERFCNMFQTSEEAESAKAAWLQLRGKK